MNRDMLWGLVVILLSLIIATTILIITNHGYEGIITLISAIAVVATQLIAIFKTHAVAQDVQKVREHVTEDGSTPGTETAQ